MPTAARKIALWGCKVPLLQRSAERIAGFGIWKRALSPQRKETR
jgi:hypothetical protein